MFIPLVSTLILWTLMAIGGYSLGRTCPKPGAVLAGILIGLLVFLWWYVLRAGQEDGVGTVAAVGFLFWLTALPTLFVVGVASGAWGRPGMTVGAWLGTVAGGALLASSSALAATAPLVLVGFSIAGGLWRRPANAG